MPTSQRLNVTLSIGEAVNSYPVWVYKDTQLSCPDGVMITQSVQEALSALKSGGCVFLTPHANEIHFPQSIQAQFTTDFWSVGTFAGQSGFMGCMMDPEHPVFRDFPTEFHSNWQWWPMCRGRAVILPDDIQPIITGLDCYARMRHMGMLVEARVGKGKLMLSSMGLLETQEYPEVRAMTRSILNYMGSGEFIPDQVLSDKTISELVR